VKLKNKTYIKQFDLSFKWNKSIINTSAFFVESMTETKILTIAIPTYNRAPFLDLCLRQICNQWKENIQYLNVIISNNASTDETEKIILSYCNKGFPIEYIKNEVNIGPDGNILQCYMKAKTQFVVVFADDDVLIDGAITKIIRLLREVKEKRCGIVYLNSYDYSNDFKREKPKQFTKNTTTYHNPTGIITKISWNICFISAIIVNKSLVDENINFKAFLKTNLVQTGWVFSAIFNGKINIYVEEQLIAYKIENTGGYKLCKVFGENYHRIFNYFIRRGIDERYFQVMRKRILTSYFPYYIYKLRALNFGKTFYQEDYWATLYPIYKKNPTFWLFTAPIIKCPRRFLNFYYFIFTNILTIISKLIKKITKSL
jgi:glycosyltransferase involved in cell wall biosynthesis